MTNNYSKLKVFRFGKEILDTKGPIKNVLMAGNFGAMNLGDEAILAGQINEIKKTHKQTKICVVSRYPEKIHQIHGKDIGSVSITNCLGLITEIIRSEIIVVGGGGLFCKSFEPVGGVLYQIYFVLLFLGLPLFLQKKVYALGIGIYKNMYPLNLRLVTFFLNRVNLVTVRDFHSYNLLKRWGVKARLFKDNSYLMPLATNNILVKKTLGGKYDEEKINIGIAVRLPFDKSQRKNFINGLAGYISKHKDYEFWFYNLDGHTNKVNDQLINSEIIKRIKDPQKNIHIIQNSKHPAVVFASFKHMDYIIAMRLHSMIFADRLNVPFDGVAYDVKCETFLNSVGKKYLPINKDLQYKFKSKITK